jgi:hypothetical protein
MKLSCIFFDSNDTRRFIGMENSNIMKAVQSVAQYKTLCNIKRASFLAKAKKLSCIFFDWWSGKSNDGNWSLPKRVSI